MVEKQPSVDEEKEESEEEESDEENDESDESKDDESEDDSDESEDDSEEDMTLAEKKRERALSRISERKKVMNQTEPLMDWGISSSSKVSHPSTSK